MSVRRAITAAVTSAALVLGTASPAFARPGWGHGGGWDRPGWGYGGGHRHYRRGDGFDFGDFLLGAIVAGGIAAAVMSSKDRKERERAGGGGSRAESRDRAAENRAADLCANAAEREAARRGNSDAQVEDISYVGRDGDGWRVEGRLSDRSRYGDGNPFVCRVSDDRVDYVRIDDGRDAYRG